MTGWLPTTDRDASVRRLGLWPVWPRHTGHGPALLASLIQEHTAVGYVIAYPRDAAPRTWYQQLGMREHSSGAPYHPMAASGA